MNAPAVLTQFALPDPNASPLNLTQLFQLANVLVSSTISEDYLSVVLRNGTPDVQDQDKVWFEKDSQGRPVNIKVFYHGKWRRVYNGMLGEIRGYSGAPGYRDNDPSSDFDANGLGSVGGSYDGWGICNGKNGRPDLSDRFLVGAHMNNSNNHTGYNNGWQCVIDPGGIESKTGGQWTETLKAENIPTPATEDLWVGRWAADTNSHSDTGQMWGKTSNVNGVPNPHDPPNFKLIEGDPGNAAPVGVFIGPPFYALAWIVFVGYSTT